jgi:hypothetical protein
LNFTPSSTDDGSPESGLVGIADDGQIVHAAQLMDVGVTEFDAADAGPVPTALVADTLNVYAVPLVNPVTVVLVAGGLPDTVFGVCAVDPMNGVTV